MTFGSHELLTINGSGLVREKKKKKKGGENQLGPVLVHKPRQISCLNLCEKGGFERKKISRRN